MATTKISLARQTDRDAGGQKITGLLDGTAATDAATKGQLDAVASGVDWKSSVRAATTAAGTLASSFANGSVIDGVTLVTGDRILVKNQAAGAENGIYVVAAAGAPTRATDADANAEVTSGLAVFVEEGTANGDTGWMLTTNGTITLGTTALVFTKFTSSAGGTVTSVSVQSANGFAGSVSNADSTPAITLSTTVTGLLKGNGAALSAAAAGTDYLAPSSFVDRETPAGTVNGSNVAFTLANVPVAGSEHVYLNGILQEPGAGNDYTISGATITYLTAPTTGDKIRVSYRK